MKRIVRLTESDLARIVKRVINEEAQSGGPAGYGDYIVQENFNPSSQMNVYASLGSTVTAEMMPNAPGKPKNMPGNKIVVNAAVYNGKQGGQYTYVGKESVTFYQICGAQANFMSKDTINAVLTGGAGWNSKPDGPIQQKLVASCKAQGFTGQIQKPGGKSL